MALKNTSVYLTDLNKSQQQEATSPPKRGKMEKWIKQNIDITNIITN
jgi:hypothetical protein